MKKLEEMLERVNRLEELKRLNENSLREIATELNKLKHSYIGPVTQQLYLSNLASNEKYFELCDKFREVTATLNLLNSEITDVYNEMRHIWYDLVFEDTKGNIIDLSKNIEK